MKEPLADIFRKHVRTGELLMDWREVNVAPIPHFIISSSSSNTGTVTVSCSWYCASINCCHGNTMQWEPLGSRRVCL